MALFLADCEHAGRAPVAGWCLTAMRNEANNRIGLLACRARGHGSGRLDWTTSQEVWFEVRDAEGVVVWTYDPLVRQEPSSLRVADASCVVWELAWAVADEQGRPLRPGHYMLRAGSTAAPLRDAAADAPFRVRDPSEPRTLGSGCSSPSGGWTWQPPVVC